MSDVTILILHEICSLLLLKYIKVIYEKVKVMHTELIPFGPFRKNIYMQNITFFGGNTKLYNVMIKKIGNRSF